MKTIKSNSDCLLPARLYQETVYYMLNTVFRHDNTVCLLILKERNNLLKMLKVIWRVSKARLVIGPEVLHDYQWALAYVPFSIKLQSI